MLNEAVKTELLLVDFVGKKMHVLSDVSQKYISCSLSLGAQRLHTINISSINSKISVQVSETNDNNMFISYIYIYM